MKRSTNKDKNVSTQKDNKIKVIKVDRLKGYQQFQLIKLHSSNYDIMDDKLSIADIQELPLKYVLKCIQGIFKNRFLFITTHVFYYYKVQGQIFGSGDSKDYNLTLQIQGAGLSKRHTALKFDGFKSFQITDLGGQRGTWICIPPQGIEVSSGNSYTIGRHQITIFKGNFIQQIQQLCDINKILKTADVLNNNNITKIVHLIQACQNNLHQYPFSNNQKQKLIKISNQVKVWFQPNNQYRRLIAYCHNEPFKGIQIEFGWEGINFYQSDDVQELLRQNNTYKDQMAGYIYFKNGKYKLITPSAQKKIYARIKPGDPVKLKLHDNIRIGDLYFQLTRFNSGWQQSIGFRKTMQDFIVIEQDLGISQNHLCSLFAVIDGHGGEQCGMFIKQNLVKYFRLHLKGVLDTIAHLSQGIKILMYKIFYLLDYQFYNKYKQTANICGATILIVLVIGFRFYVISLGDCKAFLAKQTKILELNNQHKPDRADQKQRLQLLGAFIQYQRLMGKVTISRCFGQFQYKSLQDYQKQMKGSLKSFISCFPDVKGFDINPQSDQFLMLTTDGLVQALSLGEVTAYIKSRYDKLQFEQTPQKILFALFQKAKQSRETTDNMSAILLILKKGTSY